MHGLKGSLTRGSGQESWGAFSGSAPDMAVLVWKSSTMGRPFKIIYNLAQVSADWFIKRTKERKKEGERE